MCGDSLCSWCDAVRHLYLHNKPLQSVLQNTIATNRKKLQKKLYIPGILLVQERIIFDISRKYTRKIPSRKAKKHVSLKEEINSFAIRRNVDKYFGIEAHLCIQTEIVFFKETNRKI